MNLATVLFTNGGNYTMFGSALSYNDTMNSTGDNHMTITYDNSSYGNHSQYHDHRFHSIHVENLSPFTKSVILMLVYGILSSTILLICCWHIQVQEAGKRLYHAQLKNKQHHAYTTIEQSSIHESSSKRGSKKSKRESSKSHISMDDATDRKIGAFAIASTIKAKTNNSSFRISSIPLSRTTAFQTNRYHHDAYEDDIESSHYTNHSRKHNIHSHKNSYRSNYYSIDSDSDSESDSDDGSDADYYDDHQLLQTNHNGVKRNNSSAKYSDTNMKNASNKNSHNNRSANTSHEDLTELYNTKSNRSANSGGSRKRNSHVENNSVPTPYQFHHSTQYYYYGSTEDHDKSNNKQNNNSNNQNNNNQNNNSNNSNNSVFNTPNEVTTTFSEVSSANSYDAHHSPSQNDSHSSSSVISTNITPNNPDFAQNDVHWKQERIERLLDSYVQSLDDFIRHRSDFYAPGYAYNIDRLLSQMPPPESLIRALKHPPSLTPSPPPPPLTTTSATTTTTSTTNNATHSSNNSHVTSKNSTYISPPTSKSKRSNTTTAKTSSNYMSRADFVRLLRAQRHWCQVSANQATLTLLALTPYQGDNTAITATTTTTGMMNNNNYDNSSTNNNGNYTTIGDNNNTTYNDNYGSNLDDSAHGSHNNSATNNVSDETDKYDTHIGVKPTLLRGYFRCVNTIQCQVQRTHWVSDASVQDGSELCPVCQHRVYPYQQDALPPLLPTPPGK